MPRPFIWLLLAVGLLFVLLGVSGGSLTFIVLGLLVIVGALAIGLRSVLKKEEVIDSWSALIEQAQGHANEVLADTARFIDESKAPNLEVARRKVVPSLLRGMFGVEREFLVVTETGNPRLTPYQCFLNARNYGNNLAVDWHLTYRRGFFAAFLSLFVSSRSGETLVRDFDLFDQQDLRAYTTNCHRCMLKAVDKLMAELNRDPSTIDRLSLGFLGIS